MQCVSNMTMGVCACAVSGLLLYHSGREFVTGNGFSDDFSRCKNFGRPMQLFAHCGDFYCACVVRTILLIPV